MLQYAGHFEEALSTLARALDASPSSFEAHLEKANIFRYLGRFEEALGIHQLALIVNPNSIYALQCKSETLIRLGRSASAIELLQPLQDDPPDGWSVFLMGVCLSKSKDAEQSQALFHKALELVKESLVRDPRATFKHFNFALYLSALGRSDEALPVYEYCFRLDPPLDQIVNAFSDIAFIDGEIGPIFNFQDIIDLMQSEARSRNLVLPALVASK